MNYKSNFGNSHDYNANLGYSNVSRNYNKMSFRSTLYVISDGAEEHGGLG
jgi:hypothetical protein